MIMTYAGRDATDVFSSFHAASSWALLKHMCIGELEVSHRALCGLSPPSPPPLTTLDIADTRAQRRYFQDCIACLQS